MEEDSLLSLLPGPMRDSFLEQAFQQLDQQDLLTSVSLVCCWWQQLALRSLRSIQAEPATAAAVQQLVSWLSQHGTCLVRLTSLSLSLVHLPHGLVEVPPLQPIGALSQLHSLSISGPTSLCSYADLEVSSLVQLTHLCWSRVMFCPALLKSLPALTQLQALDLSSTGEASFLQSGALQAVVSSLVQLTSLDLSRRVFLQSGEAEGFACLSALPRLRQLRLAGVQVQAGDMPKLRGLPITVLNVCVGEGQAGLVAAWLQSCTGSLESLFLWHNSDWHHMDRAFDNLEPAEMGHVLASLCLEDAVLRELKLAAFYNLQPHLSQLCTMTHLTSLALHSCGLDDGGLVQLVSLSGLCELELFGDPGIRGEQGSMEALAAGLPQLSKLMVPGTAVEDARQAFEARIVWQQDAPFSTEFIVGWPQDSAARLS